VAAICKERENVCVCVRWRHRGKDSQRQREGEAETEQEISFDDGNITAISGSSGAYSLGRTHSFVPFLHSGERDTEAACESET
jgi:hypothetical protein